MKKFGYLVLSFTTMMIILTIAFLFMLFSSGSDGLRTTMFGAIYFESQTLKNGNLLMNFGIYDNFLLVILIGTGLIFILILFMSGFHKWLVSYKAKLIDNQNENM